jgi:hypothetical protein
VGSFSASSVEQGHGLAELGRLLAERGCPVCRYVEEAERSFYSWFEIESFSAVEVRAGLRAGMGMCTAHTRRLIDEISEDHIMITVMREAVAGARHCLGDDVSPGPCSACDAATFAAERAIHLLLDWLLDPVNARVYAEHRGMCLSHVIQAASAAEPLTLKLLAERLHESLGEADPGALMELLAGVDRDAPLRCRWRGELPADGGAQSTVDGLCGRLAIEACPVCLSTGWIERVYIRWFVERSREDDPSIGSDPGELCPAHLSDVALTDQAAAADASQRKRGARRGELKRLLDGLSELPPPGRRSRRARLDGLERPRAQFVSEPYCPACHARSDIERSQLSLLVASLALSPVRERYLHSHGLCVDHAMKMTDGDLARLVKRHCDARLSVLGWELQETARKSAWACRHEPAGPERDAWLRAIAQVDGRVFEGGAAPTKSG